MGDVHLREALLDRLNLLENRIHQLSQELDDGGRSSGGDRNATAAVTCPAEKQRQMPYNSSRRESGSPFRSGSSNYQSQVSQKKTRIVPLCFKHITNIKQMTRLIYNCDAILLYFLCAQTSDID
ncbi:uncharacterized protein LOC110021695 [Phalaenopsis equestris]|uniref:uncharacterized protein LOC110021695 n=1 Tax=Phalaenopsis equestris TaxID=78828 RepID=UPI0009E4FCDC|nr:uncharacterized protein LOC110021695 [Phalaenopsis equestris]